MSAELRLDLTPLNLVPDESPLIIAGPCSVESLDQITSTAQQLASYGIKVLRAGVWKPRTLPGGFEGIGAQALDWLKEVKNNTGMKIAVEVANREHTLLAIEAGIDALWIGARTSANPFTMQEIADAIASTGKASDIVVMVKNPVSADLNLWIGALQRINLAGVTRLAAIHRGFASYGGESHFYRNPPQWRIPIELRLKFKNLPIICDPSHIGGRPELIQPISQQALDIGFDGLIIESHCCPAQALSDASQQLTPKELNTVISQLKFRSNIIASDSELTLLRGQIDSVDDELLEILSRRMELSRKIGAYKKNHSITALRPHRFQQLMQRLLHRGESIGLAPEFLSQLFLQIHDESVKQQIDIISAKKDSSNC